MASTEASFTDGGNNSTLICTCSENSDVDDVTWTLIITFLIFTMQTGENFSDKCVLGRPEDIDESTRWSSKTFGIMIWAPVWSE